MYMNGPLPKMSQPTTLSGPKLGVHTSTKRKFDHAAKHKRWTLTTTADAAIDRLIETEQDIPPLDSELEGNGGKISNDSVRDECGPTMAAGGDCTASGGKSQEKSCDQPVAAGANHALPG